MTERILHYSTVKGHILANDILITPVCVLINPTQTTPSLPENSG